MEALSSKTKTLFDQHNWKDIYPRLLYHAHQKARRLRWQSVIDGHMPGGKEVEDIVIESLEAIFSGDRAWDPEKQPDLYKHLTGIIDSKLNHLAESAENRLVRSASTLTGRDGQSNEAEAIGARSELPPTPSDEAIEKECEEYILGFIDYLSDDPLLQNIVQAILDGVEKRAEIAEVCGVKVEDITNADKRLMRRAKIYREQISKKSFTILGGE